jgi:hypothetical protein
MPGALGGIINYLTQEGFRELAGIRNWVLELESEAQVSFRQVSLEAEERKKQ